MTKEPKKPKRKMSGKPHGFAAMDPERRRAIARMGGARAVELGVNHRFTTDEARAAGRKGGLAASRKAADQAGA